MKYKFGVFAAFYFLTMMLDFLMTFFATPDLVIEGNPLVSIFGFGWISLIIANIIVYAFYLFIVYYSFVKYQHVTNFGESHLCYISNLLFDRPDRFRWVFYRTPKNWAPVFAAIGYGLAYALPISRIFVIAEWSMLLTGTFLNVLFSVLQAVPFGRLDILAALCIAIFLLFHWFFRESRIKIEY